MDNSHSDFCALWNSLDISLDSNENDWIQAIDLFDKRIANRFIEPIDLLLESSIIDHYGFITIAIDSFLIETLEAFRQGYENTNKTDDGKTRDIGSMFKSFFESTAHLNRKDIVDDFYSNFRCGILHQGEIKPPHMLSKTDECNRNRKGGLTLNYKWFHKNLKEEFELYKKNLLNLSDVTKNKLRLNFIKKMNYIHM